MKEGNFEIFNWNEQFILPDDFSKLFKVKKNNKMTLSDIIRNLNKYIRNNDLQDIENGYKINPDYHLKNILKLQENNTLTYFNLINFVKKLFIK